MKPTLDSQARASTGCKWNFFPKTPTESGELKSKGDFKRIYIYIYIYTFVKKKEIKEKFKQKMYILKLGHWSNAIAAAVWKSWRKDKIVYGGV